MRISQRQPVSGWIKHRRPREIHGYYRVTKGGQPTFEKVFNAAKLLARQGVAFNTLTCVPRSNGQRPLDVYRFLRQELNSTYIQFIPMVEYKGPRLSGLLPESKRNRAQFGRACNGFWLNVNQDTVTVCDTR